jgi:hypothetical protein
LVPPELKKLRKEQSQAGISIAAGIDKSTLYIWKSNQAKNEAFEAVLSAVARHRSVGGNYGWNQLDPRTKAAMMKYAKAATLKNCCARAGMTVSQYHNLIRCAKRLNVEAALLDYLNCEGEHRQEKNMQAGLIAHNLFVASKDMLSFRSVASQVADEQRICALKDVPMITQWFYDWAMPRGVEGRRLALPTRSADDGAATPQNDTTVTSSAPEKKGSAEMAAPNESGPDAPPTHTNGANGGRNGDRTSTGNGIDAARRATPYIPSPFQNRILRLLSGKAMTADTLQSKLGVDRKALYRDGLRELKENSFVLNSRRVGGYYRPDAPPPQFASFFEEIV